MKSTYGAIAAGAGAAVLSRAFFGRRPITRRTTSSCTCSCAAIVPTFQCSAWYRRAISASTSRETVTARLLDGPESSDVMEAADAAPAFRG